MCIATGDQQGLIEVVTDSETIANIQMWYKKKTFDKRALLEWLKDKHGTGPESVLPHYIMHFPSVLFFLDAHENVNLWKWSVLVDHCTCTGWLGMGKFLSCNCYRYYKCDISKVFLDGTLSCTHSYHFNQCHISRSQWHQTV